MTALLKVEKIGAKVDAKDSQSPGIDHGFDKNESEQSHDAMKTERSMLIKDVDDFRVRNTVSEPPNKELQNVVANVNNSSDKMFGSDYKQLNSNDTLELQIDAPADDNDKSQSNKFKSLTKKESLPVSEGDEAKQFKLLT